MSGWDLRAAAPADADALAALVQAAFEEYRGVLAPPSGAHDDTAAVLQAKMRTSQALVAVQNGESAGCVFYWHEGGRTEMGRLAVLPAHRGRGLGHALVEGVEARAREAGSGSVRLAVRLVLTDNRAFYARRGYREAEMGYHDGITDPTFVYMEKAL